jgi:uncharacterized protein (TIGR00369 family)
MSDFPTDASPVDGSAQAAARQQRFFARFLNEIPHLAMLGIRYDCHGGNWLQMAMPWRDDLLADPDHGILASGPVYSLMDNVAGFAAILGRGAFEPHATLDLRLDYLRAPEVGATIIGRAECYRMTRQIAFVRGAAHDGDPEKPIAHVAGTFMFTGAGTGGMFTAATPGGMPAA